MFICHRQRFPRHARRLLAAFLYCLYPLTTRGDSVIVFNEVMYHPATNEAAFEWVELHNQNAVDVEVGEWRLAGGIDYVFPGGTVIRGGGYLVVASDPAGLMAQAGVSNVLGPFTGRLSNGGEQLRLRDLTERVMDELDYGADGDWPAEADGSGPSLAKWHPDLASQPAENWTASLQPGGTPGAPNSLTNATFIPTLAFREATLRGDIVINEIMYHAPPRDAVQAVTSNRMVAPVAGLWRYSDTGTDLGAAWREPGYNDSAWSSGAGAFVFNTGPLPAPVGSALAASRATTYFRTSFAFSGTTSNVTFDVRPVVDDGAVYYLNGAELHRQNMPAGPVGYSTPATGPVGDADFADPIVVPSERLVQGVNVLAVEVHQAAPATGTSGIVLAGGGLTLFQEGPFGGDPPMNLARQPGAAPFAIDSLTGYPIHNIVGLTDGLYGNSHSWIGNSGGPGYAGVRFGGLHTLSGFAFGRDNLGAYSDRTLGTYTLQVTRVAAPGTGTPFTGNADTGWANIGTLSYQSAGTGLFTAPSRRHRFLFDPVEATGLRLLVPNTGAGSGTCIDELEVNPPDMSGDVAFGAELSLTTTLAPAAPYKDSDEEWVELLNRSNQAVDLTGWRLDAGIAYVFSNGPVIPPGGYVVVARDAAALRQKWPERAASVVGDFSGRLRGCERILLRDAAGEPADETRVFKGGWSDGGGSSLELRDPDADGLNRGAWADSDESAQGAWQTVTYRMIAGQAYGPTRWNEFRVGLLDAGVVLLDDVSLLRDPDGEREQLIQNGKFETTAGNTRWRFLGHHRGEFAADPDDASNSVLKLSASDRTVMNHNHVETTLLNNTPIADGQLYEISYRARWVAGSPQVSTRAYFGKLAKTTALAWPARLGTPAAPNSRRVTNAGPTFSGLQHAPVMPSPSQPVTISVRASDPDGVASATLHYRVNPATAFTALPMTLQPIGAWTASLSGQDAGKIVHFYVTALDGLGVSAEAPAKGPDSRALYQVADAQGTALPTHELRLIMLDADRDFMFQPTNVMSNARIGATLIYDRAEVFYDAGARLQGSAASRIRDGDDYVCYDIALPPDHLFRGVQNNIGIDRSGRSPTRRGQDEMVLFQMFHRAGIPIPYHDLCTFISPRTAHTGTALLQLAGYGSGFIEEQYGAEGSVFNMDITYEPNTTVVSADPESAKLPVPLQTHIGTDFTDLGDKEQYRSPFDIRSGNRRDDYSGLMRLCQVMALPQAAFDAQIAGVLDVDQALRMAALEILCGVNDTYISSAAGQLPHNLRLVTFADGAPAQLLAWDMDFAFSAAIGSSILITSASNLGKLMNSPSTRRLYLAHVNDLCQKAFTTDYITPWLTHYGSVAGQDFSIASSYISNRRAFALTQLPAHAPFAITSNAGNGFSVHTNGVVLVGTGWLDVFGLKVNGIPCAVSWSSLTNWSLALPLSAGENVLAVQAVDRCGNLLTNRTDTIAVTNTVPAELLPVVINEWMADNAGPGGFADPADGLFQDWFELLNPNRSAVDLGGFYLTDTLANPTKFAIPSNTVIAAQGFLLVWADEDGAQNSPTSAHLHANFKLSSGGEALGLVAPDGLSVQHAVTFGPQLQNVSQGLFPDGARSALFPMTNWTPMTSNSLAAPPHPNIASPLCQSDGTFTFSFATSPGRLYQVQFAEDVRAPAWQPLALLRAPSARIPVRDDSTAGVTQRFYRVLLLE